MSVFVAYLVTMLCAAAMIPLLVRVGHQLRLVDKPDHRKVHAAPIPRIGGIAIFLSTLCGLLVATFSSPVATEIAAHPRRFLALGIGSAVAFVVGLIDDISGVPSKLKLICLVGAALLLCQAGVRLDVIKIAPVATIHLGLWAWPVTVLWIVGVSVALNFIDGLDGLAGGIAAVACGALTLVAVTTHQHVLTIACVCVLASLTAFLFFNVNPARIFMGDGGSMFLGFFLAGASTLATAKAPAGGFTLPAVALAVPLLDALTTFVRRAIVERRSIFAAERGHIHHRLLDRGLPHRKAVLLLHLVTLCGTVLAASSLMLVKNTAVAGALTLALIVLHCGVFHFAGLIRPLQFLRVLRRNRGLSREQRRYQAAFEAIHTRFKRIETFAQWWPALCDAAEQFGFTRIRLRVSNRSGDIDQHRWTCPAARQLPADAFTLDAEVPVPQRRDGGTARVLIEVPAVGALELAAFRMKLFYRLIDECSLATLAEPIRERGAARLADWQWRDLKDFAATPGAARAQAARTAITTTDRLGLAAPGDVAAAPRRSADLPNLKPGGLKILLHDYGGHAFIAQLSRELAARGHQLIHCFSASVQTPQGVCHRLPDDPATLTFEPIKLDQPIAKHSLLKRRKQESEHGRRLLEVVQRHQPDVVICATTPSEIQDRLIAHCRKAGIRTVTWVQDLHGVAAYEILRRKLPVIGALVGCYYMWLDRRSLRRSDAVVLITEAFRRQMRAWGVAPDRTTCIPNWGALDEIPQHPKDNPWSRRHGLADKTVLLYAGTLAMKHNPHLLLGLAERFRDRPDVRVVVASEGASADWLKVQSTAKGLDNLRVLPFQPFRELPQMLASADVLVSVLEPEASIFSVPSKVLAYLCAGRAILLGVPHENLAARTVRVAGAGVIASPTDTEAFLDAAQNLMQNDETRAEMARRGRAYAESHFEIRRIGDRFEELVGAPAVSNEPERVEVMGRARSAAARSQRVTSNGIPDAPLVPHGT